VIQHAKKLEKGIGEGESWQMIRTIKVIRKIPKKNGRARTKTIGAIIGREIPNIRVKIALNKKNAIVRDDFR
jgi:hypothetical protein